MPDLTGGFGTTAQGLARNPLGVIALFLVLVYAIAALVLGVSGGHLADSMKWPLVLFFVVFPVLVLVAFVWLVIQHHAKLYAPGDYRSDKAFQDASVPKALRDNQPGAATTDAKAPAGKASGPAPGAKLSGLASGTVGGKSAVEGEAVVVNSEGDAPPYAEHLYLTHVAETLRMRTAGAYGLYRIRAKVEADTDDILSEVESVTWRLHETYSPREATTTARGDGFALWINSYGEFVIGAHLLMRDGSKLWLDRYLDLPGRPPD